MECVTLRVGAALVVLVGVANAVGAQQTTDGRLIFAAHCAGCHGANGAGGELGPNITDGVDDPLFTQPLAAFIRHGIPDAGMPAFGATLSAREIDAIAAYITALRAPASAAPVRGDVEAGARFYFGAGKCATCHTMHGEGGVLGPDLTNIGGERRLSRIEQALRHPGSPPREGYGVVTVRLRDGRTLRGLAKNESNYDLQLLDLGGALHALSRGEIVEERRDTVSLMPAVTAGGDTVRDLLAFLSRQTGGAAVHATSAATVTSSASGAIGDWPTYNGN